MALIGDGKGFQVYIHSRNEHRLPHFHVYCPRYRGVDIAFKVEIATLQVIEGRPRGRVRRRVIVWAEEQGTEWLMEQWHKWTGL